MNARQVDRLTAQLVREIPSRMIDLGYNRDTCILHSRVAVDVLRELGVKASAITARVMVFNQAFAAQSARLGRFPIKGDVLDDAAWNVVIGYGADPRKERPGYDGHVLVVADERWVLDLTIDQASRPKYGIVLSPHRWITTPAFLRGDELAVFEVGTPAETSFVRYEAVPEDRGFLNAPDWKMGRTHNHARVVPTNALVSELRSVAA